MPTLFVDLEKTIIESCETGVLLPDNLDRLKVFVDEMKPELIETFSWGLWEPSDLEHWNKAKELIKSGWELDIKTQNFAVKEQQLAFLRFNLGKVDENEMIDFCALLKKETAFEWFIRRNFDTGHFILIDDRVPNKQINFEDRLIITLININNLEAS